MFPGTWTWAWCRRFCIGWQRAAPLLMLGSCAGDGCSEEEDKDKKASKPTSSMGWSVTRLAEDDAAVSMVLRCAALLGN